MVPAVDHLGRTARRNHEPRVRHLLVLTSSRRVPRQRYAALLPPPAMKIVTATSRFPIRPHPNRPRPRWPNPVPRHPNPPAPTQIIKTISPNVTGTRGETHHRITRRRRRWNI